MHNGVIMSSELTHLVDTAAPYPVLSLTGVLDTVSTAAVRSAVLQLLAQQPEAVVIDVTGLRVADPGTVDVLRQIARETADWPAAHLVLCTSDGSGVWHGIGLPVSPDRGDAFSTLGDPDPRGRMNLALEPVMGAARRSRELVTEACGRWEQPDLAGPACIVVTEMVNNVVAHARTPMTVLLARHGVTMTVAVRDRSATVPQFTGPVSPTSYGGRGLLLIDSVSSRWGSLKLDDGKVVWALLQADEGPVPTGNAHLRAAGMGDAARG
jgi:hypothetical protein